MKKINMNRKMMISVAVIVILVIGFKACSNQAVNELVNSIELHEVQATTYTPMYEVESSVIARNATRHPIEGPLVNSYVIAGERVEKGDKLFMYKSFDGDIVVNSRISGIVYEMNEGYVSIASETDISVLISVPKQYVDEFEVGKQIVISSESDKWFGEVSEISSIASNVGGVEKYDVHILCDKGSNLKFGTKVKIIVELNEVEGVLSIPINASIESEGKVYVVYDKWLDNPMALNVTDYYEVDVIDVDKTSLIVKKMEELEGKVICIFKGISTEFIGELFKGIK